MLLMIRPRSLLEVVVWICVASTATGSKCSLGRRKLMVSSLVFSRFRRNKFSADQLETWSTASCTLVLCCLFGTFYDQMVSSTHFHISKSALSFKSSLVISKKKVKDPISSLGGHLLVPRPIRTNSHG